MSDNSHGLNKNNDFNLFDDMTDEEIEQFLLDSIESDVDLGSREDMILDDDFVIADVLEDGASIKPALKQPSSQDTTHTDTGTHADTVGQPSDSATDAHATLPNPSADLNSDFRQAKKAKTQTAQGAAATAEIDLDFNFNLADDAADQDTITADGLSNQIDENIETSVTSKTASSEASSSKSDFELKVDEIAQNMLDCQQKMSQIARQSDEFHDLSSQLIANMRELQLLSKDDFSITYEQIYQLRGCMLSARRAFNEIPNFYDLVTQAWENDLYTAQMRIKHKQ